MKLFIVFALIFTIALQTQAANINNHINEDSIHKPPDSEALNKCEERMCSRIYRPLCVSIDGIKTTVGSRCQLANLRCEALKHSLDNPKDHQSILRVVHIGRCFEKSKRRQNSKWMRVPEDGKYKGRY